MVWPTPGALVHTRLQDMGTVAPPRVDEGEEATDLGAGCWRAWIVLSTGRYRSRGFGRLYARTLDCGHHILIQCRRMGSLPRRCGSSQPMDGQAGRNGDM